MPTSLRHNDGCRCPGVRYVQDHQHAPHQQFSELKIPQWRIHHITQFRYCITKIKKNGRERGWEVGNPLTSLFLSGSPSHSSVTGHNAVRSQLWWWTSTALAWKQHLFNPLWPRDATWRQRSWPTLTYHQWGHVAFSLCHSDHMKSYVVLHV